VTIPAPGLTWHSAGLDDLSPRLLYALLRLRAEVFVVEQACAYLDLDGKDCLPTTRHLFAMDGDGEAAACLRLLAPGVSFTEASLGRVATAARYRRNGLGVVLMQRGLAELARRWPGPVRIGAQAYLIDFYGRFGFIVASEPYDEDGIPHVEMLLGG